MADASAKFLTAPFPAPFFYNNNSKVDDGFTVGRLRRWG
jgi:hypothetical protein